MFKRALLQSTLTALLTMSTSQVANAGVCDLTTNGATCGPSLFTNFAVFRALPAQPTQHREFFLDISENNGKYRRLLSRDELRFYLSPSGIRDTYSSTTRKLNGLSSIYDLDSGGDNWIKLDYSLNQGGGSGDMVAYLPNSLFTGPSTEYVYRFSRFGDQQKDASDAGFEEWWVGTVASARDVAEIPEPATLLLVGTGLTMAVRRRRKKAR